ncbi:MAG: lecithin retinol acyltransferase family protein [Microcystaceae cyanobacterium]
MALGDQIYVYRPLLNLQGVYQHHGIDCGDGTVIHYRKPSETIERTSIATFSWENKVYKRDYLDGFCFIATVVVNRAISRLGEQKYNLLFNNCEHFATWCKTGMSNSQQIREFVPVITRFETAHLYEPIKKALNIPDNNNTQRLLKNALNSIQVAWDDLQPRYQYELKEVKSWQKVAKESLRRNREDLAREALKRKLDHETKAKNLKQQLDQIAVMTEDVLKKLINIEGTTVNK